MSSLNKWADFMPVIIHKLKALHRAGAYKHLMTEERFENLKWLKIFNKSKVKIDIEKVKPYYLSLVEKVNKWNSCF
ncbi:hypothetical protein L6164_001126 [Bauhinia variegata]|uniref:Uncharacterized protein n=1 Tax=Bauhinia variegata TaxID=167791 RepID=A0ACB9Q9Z4_BAUVA|nr:hypothetical protein L6164_001126 [Bauhinia variegata]